MTPLVGTKAEVLAYLAPRLVHADVPALRYFPVRAWQTRRASILATCVSAFRGRRVAVRSSTRDEDRAGSGLAGHYRSELDVASSAAALARAIDRVVACYPANGRGHHVLVQAMVHDARQSGVVLTRDPETGAPYLVIELAAGPRTDAVTGGRGATSRIAVHHGTSGAALARGGLSTIARAVREVERELAVGRPLEIELAEGRDGRIALLQVRAMLPPTGDVAARDRRLARRVTRLAARVERLRRARAGIAGRTAVLGLMPDWNPAELIGGHPAPLAASLFRVLIADTTWQEARATMGYQPVPRTPLVRLLAGRPYVDVRAAFNSFLPNGLAMATRHALVNAWLARLRAHPELHDRVELEVAQTAFDFATVETQRRRFGAVLPTAARSQWLAALRALTERAVDVSPAGSLARALATLAPRETSPGTIPSVALAPVLAALADCRVRAARPFAVVARHAFMAEGLLRSLVDQGALTPDRLLSLRRSLTTVAGRLARDWARLACGDLSRAIFLDTYGHLRPGAFDITSLPYALRTPDLWEHAPTPLPAGAPFALRAAERVAIARLLRVAPLRRDPEELLAWAVAAIVGREEAKFLLTRALSVVLESLVGWGARHALGRNDLARLTVADLRQVAVGRATADELHARVAAARVRTRRERELRLGPLLATGTDVAIVREPPTTPTFVTDRTVVAPPVDVDGRTFERSDVAGRIVCIESADPGFDWLFGRGLGALVTRFGGANSHMAIRCVELGVPAVLGVGGHAFERLRAAPLVELRCGERAVRAGASPCGAIDACAL